LEYNLILSAIVPVISSIKKWRHLWLLLCS